MSQYVVRVVGPSGMERYLARGRMVERADHATHYPHPSNARKAGVAYEAAHEGERFFWYVEDANDPEWRDE